MFADRAKIYIRSGKGGDGHCSFRRELYVPNGGSTPCPTTVTGANTRQETGNRAASAAATERTAQILSFMYPKER